MIKFHVASIELVNKKLLFYANCSSTLAAIKFS